MEFVVLASSDWSPPTADEQAAGWRWTYRVDVAFAGRESRVAVSETAPRENHAAVLRLDEALSATWSEHRERAGGAWLTPWFERLRTSRRGSARGLREAVTEEFVRRHGRAPASYDWDV